MVSGEDELRALCFGTSSTTTMTGKSDQGDAPETASHHAGAKAKGIVQRYIENPLLVEDEGFKFDIRVYMLVARNDPKYLVFYHPGYCRLSMRPFTMTPQSLQDQAVHLTNAAIQKQEQDYDSKKEFQIQSPEAIAASLRRVGKVTSAQFFESGELDRQIKLCMVDVIKAGMPTLLRRRGFFDLFGFDFMLTSENELKLLEVNSNPALSLGTWDTIATAISFASLFDAHFTLFHSFCRQLHFGAAAACGRGWHN